MCIGNRNRKWILCVCVFAICLKTHQRKGRTFVSVLLNYILQDKTTTTRRRIVCPPSLCIRKFYRVCTFWSSYSKTIVLAFAEENQTNGFFVYPLCVSKYAVEGRMARREIWRRRRKKTTHQMAGWDSGKEEGRFDESTFVFAVWSAPELFPLLRIRWRQCSAPSTLEA